MRYIYISGAGKVVGAVLLTRTFIHSLRWLHFPNTLHDSFLVLLVLSPVQRIASKLRERPSGEASGGHRDVRPRTAATPPPANKILTKFF